MTLASRRQLLGITLALVAAVSPLSAAGTTYVVTGGDMGNYYEHLDVYTSDFVEVPDATVTVNGIVIPHLSGARYSGTLDAVLSEGDTVTLVVQIGSETITGVDVVPEIPVITSPADGATITADGPLLVEWTTTSDPVRYWVNAYPCDFDCSAFVDGTARSAELSTAGFSTTEPVRISVLAYHSGTFTGPADPGSNMNIRSEGPGIWITTLPGTPTLTSSWAELKHRF